MINKEKEGPNPLPDWFAAFVGIIVGLILVAIYL
jgi:hypothetical protein